MKLQLNTTNANTTIISCVRHIHDQKGKITEETKWKLIDVVTTAYQIQGWNRPRACAVSFVSQTIRNAQNH